MVDVKEAKVIELAASQELALARKRIVELEGQVALYTGRAGLARRALGWLLLLGMVAMALAASAAVVHRVWAWGFP